MKVNDNVRRVVFQAEDGRELHVHYDNRGDPYRQGVTFDLIDADSQNSVAVFLEESELRQLRDILNNLST